jgi:hypothetical protein
MLKSGFGAPKLLIFLTLVQYGISIKFVASKISYGTAKEEYRRLLVIVFRLHWLFSVGRRRAFRIPDPHSAFRLHVLC